MVYKAKIDWIIYVFSESELLIKTCMFKTMVKLDKITDVKRERGLYSFSASSYEQLKLIYSDGRKVGISPKGMLAVEKYICERKEPKINYSTFPPA